MEDERARAAQVKKLIKKIEACLHDLQRDQADEPQEEHKETRTLEPGIQSELHQALARFVHSALKPYDLYLTVQEGFFTAVDGLIFFFNREEHNIVGMIVLRRPEAKIAPIGGFTKYGETPVQTVIREAKEETTITVAGHTLTLVGAYGEPERDPRPEHIVSLAYAGLTADWPQPTEEAHDVMVMSRDEIEATKPTDWFCTDHREMALKAYDLVERDFEAMMTAFYHEE